MKTKTKTRYKLDLKITDQEGNEVLIEHHYETWMLDELASTLRSASIRLDKMAGIEQPEPISYLDEEFDERN